MTENVKNIILRHRHILLSEDIRTNYNLIEHEIISAATLPELDEAYTRKIHNFKTVSELYKWSSSINYLNNIRTPMIFINAKDDPIVPEALLEPIKKLSGNLTVQLVTFYLFVLLVIVFMCNSPEIVNSNIKFTINFVNLQDYV